MFSLSDAVLMQSYPSKVWHLCVAVQLSVQRNLFVSCQTIFLHEISGISWLTRCLLQCCVSICQMFILIVEYGLVHRGDYKLCETLFLFCIAESWGAHSFILPSLYVICGSLCSWRLQPQNERCQLIKAHMSAGKITGELFQSLENLIHKCGTFSNLVAQLNVLNL